MSWAELAGGIVSLAAITAFIWRVAIKVCRYIDTAFERHITTTVQPRFDAIDARFDDQDRALDLQSQAIKRLEHGRAVVPFRRYGNIT